MRVRAVPRLRSVPDLGEHQITAAQLATNGMDGNPIYKSDHIGRIVAVRRRDSIVAGKLLSVTDSSTEPLLILQIGEFTTAVHPTQPVTVAPAGSGLSVTASNVNRSSNGDES